MAALALNNDLLARILRVRRPRIDDWFAGKQAEEEDQERLQCILTILGQESVSAASPLNARFVRRSLDPGLPSLVDLLSDERMDAHRIFATVSHARVLTEDAKRRRGEREQRLRELGFEDHSQIRRRATLGRNVALLDWPED